MVWKTWKGDVAAASVGLLLSAVVLYGVGCVAVGLSIAFRCEDQCKMDRLYAAQSRR